MPTAGPPRPTMRKTAARGSSCGFQRRRRERCPDLTCESDEEIRDAEKRGRRLWQPNWTFLDEIRVGQVTAGTRCLHLPRESMPGLDQGRAARNRRPCRATPILLSHSRTRRVQEPCHAELERDD